MTVTNDADAFAPVPSPDSAFYWEGLREGKLIILHCTSCSRYIFPPMPGCPHCSAGPEKIERVEVSGEGTVYSWIVAHYAFDPAFASEVPYTILTVDLVEGARINGRLTGATGDAVQPGMLVRAEFQDRGDFTMLCFSPVEA
ncbi:MAG: uncharacterized protein QOH68_3801 [Nocardioidaceae bacterium]|jgi:uncharacterized OB-fold protein|nr:uncharacterized protein [Nocardioidaceae bacterium]